MWIKNIHDRSPFSLFIHALFCTMSGNKVMFPISEENLNFLLCSENLRRDLCWRHWNIRNECLFFSVHGKWIAVRNKQIAWTASWVSFFLGSWEMNRSAEQTNRVNRFVCSALRFISHEPRKKDTHSLINTCCLDFYQNYKHPWWRIIFQIDRRMYRFILC